MTTARAVIGLDIGERRIGVAVAHQGVSIAVPLETIEVNGDEINKVEAIYTAEKAVLCVIGLPRNQSGQETKQTDYTRKVAAKISDRGIGIDWQDESLTSVKAREILSQRDRGYSKSEVDSLAASLILQDYIDINRGTYE